MKYNLLFSLAESTSLSFINKQDALFGSYRGYNLTISSINSVYYINFPIKPTTELGLDKMNSFLHNLTTEFKKLNYAAYKDSSIQLQYNPKAKKYQKSEIILSILDELIDFAMINNLVTCCSSCGEELEVTPFLLGATVIPCCKNCQLEIKNTIVEQQNNFQNKSNNVVGGIVGAFIGALIGSVIWIGISQMGYIAAIAGLAIAVCSIKGYQLLGGKLNVVGIIVTCIITIIMIYLANHISLAIRIYSEFKTDYDITFSDALRSIPDLLSDPSIRGEFMSDLFIGYLLTAVGSFSYIKKAYKEANYKIKAEEIHL